MAYIKALFLVVAASLLITELCEGSSTTEDPITSVSTPGGGGGGGAAAVSNTAPTATTPAPGTVGAGGALANSTESTVPSGAQSWQSVPVFVLLPVALAKFVLA